MKLLRKLLEISFKFISESMQSIFIYFYVLFVKNNNFISRLECFDFMSFVDVKSNLQSELIINDADKILNNEIKLFSNTIHKFNEIIWNLDFYSGYTWNMYYHKLLRVIRYNDNSDIKNIWELSRMNYLIPLSQAYKLTNDTKYYNKAKFLIMDWNKNNKYLYGPNWTCAMEVALRACNLIITSQLLDIKRDKKLLKTINKMLLQHYTYILSNLENLNKRYTNNHYLANLIGLIWIIMFTDKNNNVRFNEILKEIENELNKQILSDGINYELSLPYHAFVTEMLSITYIVFEQNNMFSQTIRSKIKSSVNALTCILKKDFTIPLIGDIDSSRFTGLFYSQYRTPLDYEYLVKLLVNKCSFKHKFLDIDTSYLFEDAGIFLKKNEDYYFIIRCGRNGTNGKGGHCHNDQLSFEFSYKNINFIVDSGMHNYSANIDLRNLQRSTQAHNTLYIENYEQNDFNKRDLFNKEDESNGKIIDCNDYYFYGIHSGFEKKLKTKHKRHIYFEKKIIRIVDKVDKTHDNMFLNFCVDPNVEIFKEKSNAILKRDDVIIKMVVEGDFEVVNHIYSPGYGLEYLNKRIKINFGNKSILETKLLLD